MYCFIEIWAEAHSIESGQDAQALATAEFKVCESQAALAASMEQCEEDAADAKTCASLEGEATVV